MIVRVRCSHWEREYRFRVDGHLATALDSRVPSRAADRKAFDVGGMWEPAGAGVIYDTETLQANASLWEKEQP